VFLGRELTVSGFLGRIGFVDRRGMRTRANTYLSAMGINLPSLSSPVENLSGGQMQAVAVARAVYWHPQLLIMDEPTAALGPYQTDQVLSVMQRVRDEEGISILLISHSLPEVFRVADRITVLRGGKCVFTRKTDELTLDLVVAAMTGAFTTEGNPPVVGL
jgi:ABC-type sugar transport system ATPase subunit